MGNNRISYAKAIRVAWPRASFLAAVAAAGVIGGVVLPLVDGRAWQTLLPAMLLTATAVLGFVRLSRAHTARRLKAAMDAFAEREIARTRRRKAMTSGFSNRSHCTQK